MSNFIEQKYQVIYQISKAYASSRQNFEFDGTKFASSVAISTTNVASVKNEATGGDDIVEYPLIIRINCSSDSMAGILSTKFNEFFKAGHTLEIVANPTKYSNKEFVATVIEDEKYFLDLISKTMTSKK